MKMNVAEILEQIFCWIPNSQGYRTKIAPILIKKEMDGSFDSKKMLNRFAYTIIDQQRNVDTVIIPIWNTMLYYGMNYEFLIKSEYAHEFVSTILQAYGHQQYHTKEQIKLTGKSFSSRTDAFIECFRKRSPDEFLEFLIKNKDNLMELFNELTEYPFISDKSAAFFLRDIEGIEFNLVPIDSNVARSIQLTGLFFVSDEDFNIEFKDIKYQIIPIKERTNPKKFRVFSDKIFNICKNENKSPYQFNRFLFILGADYCQNNRCSKCKIKEYCFYNNLNKDEKNQFKKLLGIKVDLK